MTTSKLARVRPPKKQNPSRNVRESRCGLHVLTALMKRLDPVGVSSTSQRAASKGYRTQVTFALHNLPHLIRDVSSQVPRCLPIKITQINAPCLLPAAQLGL